METTPLRAIRSVARRHAPHRAFWSPSSALAVLRLMLVVGLLVLACGAPPVPTQPSAQSSGAAPVGASPESPDPLLAPTAAVVSGGTGPTPAPAVPPFVYPTVAPSAPPPDPGRATAAPGDADREVASPLYGSVLGNQFGVMLAEGSGRAIVEGLARDLGAIIVGEIALADTYQLELATDAADPLHAAIARAAATPGVELAFPIGRIFFTQGATGQPCPVCEDPLYRQGGNNRANEMIGLADAWNIIRLSGVPLHTVQAGVVDTALNKNSDESKGRVSVGGLDAIDLTESAELTHGTAVSNVLGADHTNGGVAGVAGVLGDKLKVRVGAILESPARPNRVAIPDAQDLSRETVGGVTYSFGAFRTIIEQIRAGSTVINCSYGPRKPDPAHAPMAAAYRRFLQRVAAKYPKVVFVAAAGNEGAALDGQNDYWGQKLPNLITVGALDGEGNRASFSNFATGAGEITLSAPGTSILVGVGQSGRAENWDGTSFAAPQVAGAVALIQSVNPYLSAAEIKEILVKTAGPGVTGTERSVPIPTGMGAGVLRVDDAVLAAINRLRPSGFQLTREALLARAMVQLVATGGPAEYTITATVPALAAASADLRLHLEGKGAARGRSAQTIAAAGSASWVVAVEGEPVAARVTRSDTGGCAIVDLIPPPVIAGLAPEAAWYEEELTVRGTGFGIRPGAIALYDAKGTRGLVPPVISWSDREIRLKVPRGLLDPDTRKSPRGEVDVVVLAGASQAPTSGTPKLISRPQLRDGAWTTGFIGGGVASRSVSFSIGGPLGVTRVVPATPRIGQEVTITGLGFGATRTDSAVGFCGRTARTTADCTIAPGRYVSWKADEIKVTVPQNVAPIGVAVHVGGVSRWVRLRVDFLSQMKEANLFHLSFSGEGTYARTGVDGPPRMTSSVLLEAGGTTAGATVVWRDRSFTYTRQETLQDQSVRTYEMRGTFSELGDMLLEASATMVQTHPAQQRRWSFRVANLPMNAATANSYGYFLKGPTARDHVSDVKVEQTWTGRGAETLAEVDWAKGPSATLAISLVNR